MRAIRRLPSLSTLALNFYDEDWEAQGGACGTARVLRVRRWLHHCHRLSHLELSVLRSVSARKLLAAVAAAVGGRLRTLTLCDVQLPPTRDAAARDMCMLVGRYPCLEVLTLRLCAPYKMEGSTANALSRGYLLAAPAVAALCPVLREVLITWEQASRGYHAATWLRVRAWPPLWKGLQYGCG